MSIPTIPAKYEAPRSDNEQLICVECLCTIKDMTCREYDTALGHCWTCVCKIFIASAKGK